jgi:hypothetical protein
VLAGVLSNEGADVSAHETLERAQRQLDDFATLAAEYETLARAAQQQRWDELLDRSGLGADHLDQLRQSDAYGPLLAALREAEARDLDVERAFPRLVASRSLSSADDPAAVIHGRVDRWVHAAGSKRRARTNLIAGLIPRAVGVTDSDMAQALDDRDEAMQRRARVLAERAIERGDPWVRQLGLPPSDRLEREQWINAISTVAAFRDRWNIGDDPRPLGPDDAATTIEAGDHRMRAQVAVERALRLTRGAADSAGAVGVAIATTARRGVEL